MIPFIYDNHYSLWKRFFAQKLATLLFIAITIAVHNMAAKAQASNCKCIGEDLGIIEEDIRKLAIEEKRIIFPGAEYSVFITSRPDLDRDLIELQYLLPKPNYKTGGPLQTSNIHIYDVTNYGHKINDKCQIVTTVGCVDDCKPWRVAYDCSKRHIYHLYGFSDSVAGFRNLIKDIGLSIETKEHARFVQNTFVKLTYLESMKAEVRNALDLMAVAIEDFQVNNGNHSEKEFRKFWSRIPDSVKNQISAPVESTVEYGFKVVFYTSVEGVVSKNSIILRDGQIDSLDSKEIFSWGNVQAEE